MALVLEIAGKYLLTPSFELLLNLGTCLSSHADDVSVIFTTSAKYKPALNLFIKVDVVDLLSDWTALMQMLVETSSSTADTVTKTETEAPAQR